MAKYIIKFEKSDSVKYVSHLDLVRVFGRTMRRAGLPIAHSQGFNPHPLITFAHPLSIGISSIGELAEITLNQSIPPDEVISQINNSLPNGIKITAIKQHDDKSNFGKIALADYNLNIYLKSEPKEGFLDGFFSQEHIMCIRKTKSKTENTDIKPYIISLELIKTDGATAWLKARLKTGADNLKPLLVATSVAGFLETGLIGVEINRISLLDSNGTELF